jgi:hypothetical protein
MDTTRCSGVLNCRQHWHAQGVALLFAAQPGGRHSVLGIFQHLHLLRPAQDSRCPKLTVSGAHCSGGCVINLSGVGTNWLQNISSCGAVLLSSFGLIILRPGIRRLQLPTILVSSASQSCSVARVPSLRASTLSSPVCSDYIDLRCVSAPPCMQIHARPARPRRPRAAPAARRPWRTCAGVRAHTCARARRGEQFSLSSLTHP